MSDLISVIVPVYNVEQYLDKCVESIINQSYKNLEIILVDDGSTDSSGRKCDDWKLRDARINVIHKENGGLSDARNAGLAIATGMYIGFVDSDDWIDIRMYEKLYQAIIDTNSSISICGYLRYYENTTKYEQKINSNRLTVYGGREIVNFMTSDIGPNISYSVWKCLYEKQVIENQLFPVGRYYEDVLFNIYTMWKVERVAYIDSSLYYYRIRTNSIIGVGITDKHVIDLLEYSDKICKFYMLNGNRQERKNVYTRMMEELLSIWRIYKHNPKHNEKVLFELESFIDHRLSTEEVNIRIKLLIKYILYKSGRSKNEKNMFYV